MVHLILLNRLGGPRFALNPDLIERAEESPDTVITLVGGNKYVVDESLLELVELINDNRARVIANAELLRAGAPGLSAQRGAAPKRKPQQRSVITLHPREG